MMRNSKGLILLLLLLLGTMAAQAQDTRENAEFKLAVRLYDDGLYAQAEDQFRSFIEAFPNTAASIEARFYLGLLERKARKFTQAKATFQDFALRHQDNPRAPDAWWNVAEIFAEEGNYAEAASAFARLKSLHPRSAKAPQALILASRYFLRAGDTENARTVLNSILLEYSQSEAVEEAQYTLGRLFLESGEFTRAFREFDRLRSKTLEREMKARAIVGMGEAEASLGNRSGAELRFSEVINSYAQTTAVFDAYVRLGDLQLQFREFTKAAATYRTVAENLEAPSEVRQRAYTGAAEALIAEGQFADAALMYENLFKAFRDGHVEAGVYSSAAEASRLAGDHLAAEKYLEHLYRDTVLHIDRRALLVELAKTAVGAGKYSASIGWYKRYLEQYPHDPGAPFAIFHMAEIYELRFQNYTRALELYSAVLENHTDSPVADAAQYARGRVLEKQNRFALAAEAYRQVMQQFPGSELYASAMEKNRRISMFERGPDNEMLEHMVPVIAALQQKQGSAEVDILLGRIYLEDLKNFEQAKRFFEHAEQKNISGADAEDAAYGKAIAALRLAQEQSASTAEAEQLLAAFLQQYPTSNRRDDAAFALYGVQSAEGGWTSVLDAATAFLALNPVKHRDAVQLAYADALRSGGKYAEAEAQYAELLTGENTPEAWYGRAMARVGSGAFEKAVEDFAAYDKAQPGGRYAATALLAGASVLSRIGRYSEAAEHLVVLADRFSYSDLADSARIREVLVLTEGRMLDAAIIRVKLHLDRSRANPFSSDRLVQEYLYSSAVVMAGKRDASAAKRTLQQYVQEFPNGRHIGDVYFALGQIYKDEGMIGLATSYLQQAAALSGGSAARQDVADLMLDNGNFEGAIGQYEQLEAAAENAFERRYAQSRIVVALYGAGRSDEAARKAGEFRESYPEAEPVFDEFDLERGKHLYRQKQYSAAMDVFEDVEGSDTETLAAMGLYWTGKVYEAQSINEKARDRFTEVVEQHPATLAAVYSSAALARMAYRAEKFDVAALNYRSVVEAGNIPKAMIKEALSGLVRCYEEMKMYDVAVEMTKRFITLFPNDPTVFRKKVNLGVFYYQLRYYDQAVVHFEALLGEASADDQAEIHYYIGECYYYKGDFKRAALEFLKVPYLVVNKTEIDWTSSAYNFAGQSYKKMSKFDLAIEMFQKIIDTPGADSRFKAQAKKEIDQIISLTGG